MPQPAKERRPKSPADKPVKAVSPPKSRKSSQSKERAASKEGKRKVLSKARGSKNPIKIAAGLENLHEESESDDPDSDDHSIPRVPKLKEKLKAEPKVKA